MYIYTYTYVSVLGGIYKCIDMSKIYIPLREEESMISDTEHIFL